MITSSKDNKTVHTPMAPYICSVLGLISGMFIAAFT
jgi:hypothetical protein